MLYIINSSVIYIYIYSSLSMATVIVLGCTFRLSNFEPLLYYAHTHTDIYTYTTHRDIQTQTHMHKCIFSSSFSLESFICIFFKSPDLCKHSTCVCTCICVFCVQMHVLASAH